MTYNGVDLDVYTPGGERPADVYRLLVVEGKPGGGYENGLKMPLCWLRRWQHVLADGSAGGG